MADVAELRSLLRRELSGRLREEGWSSVDDAPGWRFTLSRFVHPLGDGFEATAEVDVAVGFPERLPVAISGLQVGVAYGPLRGLWRLLGGRFSLALLSAEVGPSGVIDLEDEDDDDEDGTERWRLRVSSPSEVPGAAERLAAVVVEHAVPFAERYASVEALIGEFADPEEPGSGGLGVAALLGAAGRFDEARVVLDRWQPPAGRYSMATEERRTAYQLGRWITSRGDRSLLPAAPPADPLADRGPGRSFRESYAETRASRDALVAVRENGRGLERGQLRERLERELADRGAHQDPLWIERSLDHLWDTGADQLRAGAEGFKALARIGLKVAKALRDHELPDPPTPPEWLEPPDPAFYVLPRSDRWIAVQLGPDADTWLDRVYEATPLIAGIAHLDAWLRAAPDSAVEEHEIVVHVGERPVGVIREVDAVSYRPAMRDAAFRAESPRLQARLARVGEPSHYLLELAQPRAR